MDSKTAPEKLGRYEIVRELGKGAMGVVYEGIDPSLGRRVAIKTARRDVIERSGLAQEMMERFLREARAAGMLNHPNIITIYDVGEQDGLAYMAMEFLEGSDLDTLMEKEQRLDVEKVVDYGTQICEALACAHDQGVYHRDVKPANIFVPNQGVLKVVDFGIARTHDSTLTQDGALIGTPNYMSPEQFMGQKVDARSDLFSLGIILYEMLTGEKPFVGEALTTIMHHILKSDPAPPQEFNYLVPEALGMVVMKALSKKPKQRYTNGRAMAQALRESLKDAPDMTVINETAISTASTVVSAAPPPEQPKPEPTPQEPLPDDGTLIESTTVSLSAPPPASAPVHDATVAGEIPQEFADYTLTGAAPPEAAPAPPPPVKEPAAATAKPDKAGLVQLALQHNRLVVGGIAVLILLAGLGLYILAPAQSIPPEAAPTEAATTAETVAEVPVAREMERVYVYVWSTSDLDIARDADNKQRQGEDITEWIYSLDESAIKEASGITVKTSHPTTGEVFDEQLLQDYFGQVAVPADAPAVHYDILRNGQSLHTVTVTIEAGQKHEAQRFVLFAP